jgi:hypothetical protein
MAGIAESLAQMISGLFSNSPEMPTPKEIAKIMKGATKVLDAFKLLGTWEDMRMHRQINN